MYAPIKYIDGNWAVGRLVPNLEMSNPVRHYIKIEMVQIVTRPMAQQSAIMLVNALHAIWDLPETRIADIILGYEEHFTEKVVEIERAKTINKGN